MRLIDAEVAEEMFPVGAPNELYYGIKTALDKVPTVDAVPVVRCKDCTYAGQIDYDSEYDYECGYHDRLTDGNCFCNYGERREVKDDGKL